MVLPMGYLIFFLCVSCVCTSADISNSEETNCNKYYSSDFSYGHFYKISELKSLSRRGFFFEFQVKTPSDAHIKFSERAYPSRHEPAYEVAIGAGRNTFSFIRRDELGLSKIRLDTPAFLSSEEVRGFWIRISKYGKIDVGKEGDMVPFMEWEDEHPLDIKYFAFSSWDHISAEWYFNCTKSKGKNDRFYSHGTVKDIVNFIKKREYANLETEPPLDPDISNYTNVYTHLLCNHISLDDERSIIVVDGVLFMLWEDGRITWPSEEFGNITHLDWKVFEIWTPKLILHNIADKELKNHRESNSRVRAYSNGTLLWKYPVHFSAFCQGINHNNWPKDKHTCELQLVLISPHHSLQLTPMKEVIHLPESRIDSEWDINAIAKVNAWTKWLPSLQSTSKQLDELKYPGARHIIIEFTLTRSNNSYYSALIISLAAISILMVLSFWASPLRTVKMGLQCSSLVIASLSLLFCWKMIPVHNSKDLPSVFSAFITTIHMVWISIVSSVVISTVIFSAPANIPSSFSSLLRSKFLSILFCLPQPSNKVAMCYNRLCDGNILSKEDSEGYSFKSKECESQWNWILISTITERILFCAYSAVFIYIFSTLH